MTAAWMAAELIIQWPIPSVEPSSNSSHSDGRRMVKIPAAELVRLAAAIDVNGRTFPLTNKPSSRISNAAVGSLAPARHHAPIATNITRIPIAESQTHPLTNPVPAAMAALTSAKPAPTRRDPLWGAFAT